MVLSIEQYQINKNKKNRGGRNYCYIIQIKFCIGVQISVSWIKFRGKDYTEVFPPAIEHANSFDMPVAGAAGRDIKVVFSLKNLS